MGTARLSFDKIETNSYTNLLTLMDDRSLIADPRDADSKKFRQFIYDFDPFHLAINFNDMPYIIVEMGEIEYIRTSANGKQKGIRFKHRIVVRTARRGAGNTTNTDLGRTDMLNIIDDLHELCNVISKRQRFMNLNMYNMTLTKISTDTYSVDQKYCYESVFELSYITPFLNVNN